MPLIYKYIIIAFLILFFGTHVIYGYVKCVQSDWALCPGTLADEDTEQDEEE
jgi:hypothetical protein